jgi:hypothetical protein
MSEPSLTDELTATLQELDTLMERHQEGQDYAAAQERLAWFQTLVDDLYDELVAFKAIALSATESYHGESGAEIWRKTCAELRANEPASFRSPARALIAAHLDLLELVVYTVQARVLLHERRAWLTEDIRLERMHDDTDP